MEEYNARRKEIGIVRRNVKNKKSLKKQYKTTT